MPSVVANDLKIYGTLESDGVIEIEGTVVGDVHCLILYIRKNGFIRGNIYVDTIKIDGCVYGDIEANHITIAESAHITGTFRYQTISIKNGAYIEGQLVSHLKVKPNFENPPQQPVNFELPRTHQELHTHKETNSSDETTGSTEVMEGELV